MSFDLSTFTPAKQRQEEGVAVSIKHPVSGEDLGMTFYVCSYESERVRKTTRDLANQILSEQRRNPKRVETAEMKEQRALAIVIASVVRWEGVEFEGQSLIASPENIRMVIEKFPWIGEQLDAAASDRSLFFGS